MENQMLGGWNAPFVILSEAKDLWGSKGLRD